MMRLFAITAAALLLSACGVQRPLMKPKDIPAYEAQQREKRERLEQEQRDDEAQAAARAAAQAGGAQ
ncbi:MAG: hypothetical protein V4735_08270 [Pseudomonadota bacterium]